MPFFQVLAVAVVAITTTLVYTASAGGSFTIDLVHRDSIDSPFYDPSIPQRIGHALKRSFSNAKRYKTPHTRNQLRPYQPDLIPDHGEFLINISFGNPPQKVLAIADTGSDMSWMSCEPCIHCYNHTAPLFNPKRSSTYQALACESTQCKAIETVEISCSSTNHCRFFESYADGSITKGTVSTETVILGHRVVPNIVFGCSFYNDAAYEPTWGGIIGLGGGESSLSSQLTSLAGNKQFSYCLIPFTFTDDISNKSSKMTFGGMDFGPYAVSTPLVPKDPKTYYYVTLQGLSVGDKRLNLSSDSSEPVSKGNMIVDSGTTLTMLPTQLYNQFEAALKDAINVTTMEDPQKVLSLCYPSAKVTILPIVQMHFDGADVRLRMENLFVTVSEHIMCLAYAPTSDLPIMGNVAQLNMHVGFDLQNKMLSFEHTKCENM